MSQHFVLDHNFPVLVTGMEWPPGLVVSRLADYAPDLTKEVEDWEVLLELSMRGGIDGFITNDADMLLLAPEMFALSRTHLSLIVTDGVGHQPFRATGLILLHIEEIVKRVDGKPRTFLLRPNARITQQTPYEHINRIALIHHLTPVEVINAVRGDIEARIRTKEE